MAAEVEFVRPLELGYEGGWRAKAFLACVEVDGLLVGGCAGAVEVLDEEGRGCGGSVGRVERVTIGHIVGLDMSKGAMRKGIMI